MAEEEKGYEVVDKRHTSAAESADQAEAAAAEEPGFDTLEGDEDESDYGDFAGSSFGGGMPKMGVSDILRVTLNMLNEKAWINMGLIPDPLSGQMERDLAEARLAIDVLADLAKHLEPHAEGAEKRELQVMVSNLRINYVQQSRT